LLVVLNALRDFETSLMRFDAFTRVIFLQYRYTLTEIGGSAGFDPGGFGTDPVVGVQSAIRGLLTTVVAIHPTVLKH